MKRAFLFGAGAEKDFGISGGADFAKKILLSKDPAMYEINKAVKTYYKGKKEILNSWYPKYVAEGWNETQIVRAAVKKKNLNDGVNIKPADLTKEVKRLMSPENSSDRKELLDENTSYMGLADERYHTLIEPNTLGSKCFWSIINCYSRAYLLITGQMLGFKTGVSAANDYLEILNDPTETYEELIAVAKAGKLNETYYKIVRELAPNSLVITTNYTPYAQIVTEQETINIHGDFSLFESARELRVYDVKNKEIALPQSEVLFPYISIQGGVKPLIERMQMSSYGNMVSKLSAGVEQLIIVGYEINPDDNHLNSVIRSFLVEDKKQVVYFAYSDGCKDDICRRLRLTETEATGLVYYSFNKVNTVRKFADFLIK